MASILVEKKQSPFSPKIFIGAVIGVVALVIIVLLLGGFSGILSLISPTTTSQSNPCSVLSGSAKAPGIANSSTTSSTAYFTIIEADPVNNYEGMNGSAFHVSSPWPIIQVHQGQTVVIHIYNCASSEAHGFAITHYLNAGATIQEGQSYTVMFAANQAGTFRIYCNIFCAIHPLMQNGELIVTSN